jgi:hypothetical protein
MRPCLAAVFLPHFLVAQSPALRPVQVLSTGGFTNPDIRESSGVARSRVLPGVLFTINDSDNDPVVFAFDSSGPDLGHWWSLVSRTAIGRPHRSGLARPDPVSTSVILATMPNECLPSPSIGFASPPAWTVSEEAMWVGDGGAIFVVTKGRIGDSAAG